MRDNKLSMPPDLTLLFKALITLEGLGHQLDPDFHMVDQLTPFVRRGHGGALCRRRRWRNVPSAA
jgi:ubiquinone biosynthesis protein